MKKHLLCLLSIFVSYQGISQSITWSAPVSVAPAINGNLQPRISVDGSGDPVVVWGSNDMGGRGMFARWDGTAFAAPVALNPMGLPVFVASWAGPDMAAHGDTLYAVMKNTPEDTGKMYINRSFDGGQNWSGPIAISSAADTNRFPTVTTNATGNPIVGYMQFDMDFLDPRYVVSTSNNFGSTFGAPVIASNPSAEACDCCPATIKSSGDTVVMLYRNNESNIRTMWAGISFDGGNSFNDSLEVDNTNWMVMSCPSSGPDGIIVNDTLYTVFRSSVSGARCYLSKSSVSNPQLANVVQYAPNFTGLSSQDYPRIDNNGNAAAIVWKQVVTGTSRLCISFTQNITDGFPTAYDTVASNGAINGDVAIAPGVVHVVWQDNFSGTVMYRKGTYTTTSIARLANNSTIEIYPNPASEYFTVSQDVTECVLIDGDGRSIMLTPHMVNGNPSFSLKGIATGIYTVKMMDKTGNVHSSKLLVK